MAEEEQTKLSETDQARWKELHEVPVSDLTDEEITSKLHLSLKRRFSYGEWMLMFEFGAPNGRVADAIAVNTLASRNYKIVGFELKASRSDWLREKNDGEKADYFVQLCDEWYVVAPKGVVEQRDLPEGWGYLEMKPNSEQLYKMVEADPTEHQRQGGPDRYFWIKFLKRTVGDESNFSKADLEEAKSRGAQAAKDRLAKRSNPDVDLERLRKKANSWDKLADRFKPLPWSSLSDEELKTLELAHILVRKVHRGHFGDLENELDRLENNINRHMGDMQDSIELLKEGVGKLATRVEDGRADGLVEE